MQGRLEQASCAGRSRACPARQHSLAAHAACGVCRPGTRDATAQRVILGVWLQAFLAIAAECAGPRPTSALGATRPRPTRTEVHCAHGQICTWTEGPGPDRQGRARGRIMHRIPIGKPAASVAVAGGAGLPGAIGPNDVSKTCSIRKGLTFRIWNVLSRHGRSHHRAVPERDLNEPYFSGRCRERSPDCGVGPWRAGARTKPRILARRVTNRHVRLFFRGN